MYGQKRQYEEKEHAPDMKHKRVNITDAADADVAETVNDYKWADPTTHYTMDLPQLLEAQKKAAAIMISLSDHISQAIEVKDSEGTIPRGFSPCFGNTLVGSQCKEPDCPHCSA
jgi:hypothetical protein